METDILLLQFLGKIMEKRAGKSCEPVPLCAAMPLLQTPGPAPDFTANAYVNGALGNVALKDYKVRLQCINQNARSDGISNKWHNNGS